jgi:RNA polymerase sigma-70 factor (ECF subfamily)
VLASETFETLRPLLFAIAYRMLATVSDAEDIVQDTYLRHQRALADGARIESLKAYLTATVTHLAIDQLRSARARRETYVGQWLPEPIATYHDGDPLADSERAESVSMAFLLLLQRLRPMERAAFLLHDVFGYEHAEVAAAVGKSEENCRQLALRARRRVDAERPRFEPRADVLDDVARRFFAAVSAGDLDALLKVVAADAVVYGDGGGKVPQWSQPIAGRDRVARLLAGVGNRLAGLGGKIVKQQINGHPGAMVIDADGLLINVFALDIADGAVQAVRSVINPEKLRHLGPLAEVRALLERAR